MAAQSRPWWKDLRGGTGPADRRKRRAGLALLAISVAAAASVLSQLPAWQLLEARAFDHLSMIAPPPRPADSNKEERNLYLSRSHCRTLRKPLLHLVSLFQDHVGGRTSFAPTRHNAEAAEDTESSCCGQAIPEEFGHVYRSERTAQQQCFNLAPLTGPYHRADAINLICFSSSQHERRSNRQDAVIRYHPAGGRAIVSRGS